MKYFIWFCATMLLSSSVVYGAIPVRQAAGSKEKHYLEAGVFVGGRDHGPMALVNLRHSLQKGASFERLVFDLESVPAAQPSMAKTEITRPGFFHAAIQTRPARIVIDLEDIKDIKVTRAQAEKLWGHSPFLGKVQFYPDPASGSLTIEILLKKKAQMEVFELAAEGKPGRIVMDIEGK